MKNYILNCFLILFTLFNLFLYDVIGVFTWLISDIFWMGGVKIDIFCIILGVLILAAFIVFLVFFFKYREKGEMVCPVEFSCPDDMTPLELGMLVDGSIDGEDLSSLLVYWASKGYLEIGKDTENQKLTKKVDALPENARDYEKKLFKAIFGDDKEISVSGLEARLQNQGATAVNYAVNSVNKTVGEKYFNNKSIKLRQIFVCVFAVLYYVSAMYLWFEYVDYIDDLAQCFIIISTILLVASASWVLSFHDYRHRDNKKIWRVLSIVCAFLLIAGCVGMISWLYFPDVYQIVFLSCTLGVFFVVLMLSCKMQIYTAEGRAKLGRVLGFKQFLSVAEKDRIEMLVKDNPNVYYDVLPYAFVLGVSDTWIKSLDVIRVTPNVDKAAVAENLLTTMIFVNYSRNILMPIVRLHSSVYRNAGINHGGHHFGGPGGSGGGFRGMRGGGHHHGR